MKKNSTSSRRDFLKTTGALAAGATLVGGLGLDRSAHAAGSDQMKIALVGCGGRGRGAIMDRLQVGDNVKVVAIADAFEGNAKNVANVLYKENEKDGAPAKGKIDLTDERVFSGFDGYRKAIDCLSPGDQVVIATTPGFRPYHYRYAIEKGVHVFMEKPLFTDAPGYRHVMDTNKMADEKGLKVCVGLQRRYEPHYYNWARQILEGKIGDVSFSRVYWNGGGIWCRPRQKGDTEMTNQMRNWYHFVWLCGDNICEQHVHNLDIGNWIHGKGDKMAHPVAANAQGGRQNQACSEELRRTAPPYSDQDAWWAWYEKNKGACNRYGQAWDHFFIEFTYADGSKMFSQCRHIAKCWDSVSEHIHGTNGTGGPGWLKGRDGKDIWRNEEKAVKGPYQWEHDCQVKAIRENQPMNDGWHSANATMCAVLGRLAAYSGKELKWDDAVNKGVAYVPTEDKLAWDANPPVMPDEDGFYEKSVAKQGVFNPFEG